MVAESVARLNLEDAYAVVTWRDAAAQRDISTLLLFPLQLRIQDSKANVTCELEILHGDEIG
jgi:hypothetical protein